MLSRFLHHRFVPMAAIVMLMAGCLELTTVDPSNETGETSSSSSTSSNGSSTSSSASSSAGSSSSTASSSTSSSTSSTASSASSSASSASSGGPVVPQIIAKSNLGTTFQSGSNAVVCGLDPQMLPAGTSGDALECTHITDTTGAFLHGLSVDLQSGVDYVFTFFFRNGNFDSPYGQSESVIGIKMTGPNANGGSPLYNFDAYPNGWYRQRFLFTAKNTGTYQWGFTHSLNRPPGGGYWLYGFQMETGFAPSEYIPE